MSVCKFYSYKQIKSESKVMPTNRNPRKQIIREYKKCSHPESKHKTGAITQNVTCEGNIEHCIIPMNLR